MIYIGATFAVLWYCHLMFINYIRCIRTPNNVLFLSFFLFNTLYSCQSYKVAFRDNYSELTVFVGSNLGHDLLKR